ncbi:BBT_HP_G0129600.mRNA.1.CDS.1 [Saccharomyces cerevisiae]|nr:BBT_HP_G0094420.mRNA.1.CDS.1 [Saccharomyces cerevisiae]CAI5098457.1 BBT_HP_G0129600.mRNA.1.CDS.1 [Saccharomyces cerevisiae]CAI6932894.1 BBT_HP_G0094420.mRNA.1.CDS.1 [Saccharomyces cerevisiae]CAI6973341.1 BBT_HP_G0129600.mRNA.1.CDS.1 [Saccharomyces cerevisiae]
MNVTTPEVAFREYQTNCLASYISADPDITPPNLILQGYSGTGKTYTLKKYFNANPNLHAVWLEPVELVSWKPLLQAIARTVQYKLKTLYPNIPTTDYDPLQVEEPFLLVKTLHNIFVQYESLQEKTCLFLILDGFDSLQDLDAALFNKYIKLNELLPKDSKINIKFIYTMLETSFLQRYSTHCIPTVMFPRYNVDEVSTILVMSRCGELMEDSCLRKRIIEEQITDCTDDQFQNVAANFIHLIVQAFHSYTGNDIFALNDLIDFKWPKYVSRITKENIFEPLALYKSAIKLFLSTDDNLSENGQGESAITTNRDDLENSQTYDLSIISKYLLIASYICSYLEPRYDASIFSRKTRIIQGRAAYGRRKKKEVNPRYLQPSLFAIERLLAIFQAIFPIQGKAESGSLSALREESLMKANIEVFQNLSELHTLKLIATTMNKNIDYLSPKVRWKVNVPWEIIKEISESVHFNISDYFSDIHE